MQFTGLGGGGGGKVTKDNKSKTCLIVMKMNLDYSKPE